MYYIQGRKDRSGAQIQKYICGLFYASKLDIKVQGIQLFKFIKETEELVQLLGLPPYLKDTAGLKLLSFGKNEIKGRKFTPEFLNQLRTNFNYQEKNTKDVLHIGIHIRRGDVSLTQNSNRFLPNDYYLSILNKIKEITNKKMRIDIFSEKDSCESFDVFTNNFSDCFIHLNDDLKYCWETLINSDIFIMSKGSFSFVPALYNKNIVIYNSGLKWQDCIALPEWIKYKPSNIEEQLRKKLQTYLT